MDLVGNVKKTIIKGIDREFWCILPDDFCQVLIMRQLNLNPPSKCIQIPIPDFHEFLVNILAHILRSNF
jgi:hypothetical protein